MKDCLLNVLIVDEESTNIEMVANLLDEKYNIFVANCGSKALELINNITPHIILLDISMAEMDGFELTQKIFEDEKNKDIHIIFLSANSSIDYLEKGFNLGASDYIAKPLIPQKLFLKMKFWSKLIKNDIENKQNLQLLEQYKNVVDRSAIISKTDSKGKITYINERFSKISGYSSEELIGKSHNIVRHEDMPSSTFKELWKTIKSKKIWHGIVKNRKKNGDVYIVDTVINPILDSEGNVVEYIGVRYDITELEAYKELLKHELSTTNQTLEENKNYLAQYEEAINSITAVMKTDTNNIITYVNKQFCDTMEYLPSELIGKNCEEIGSDETKNKGYCKETKEEMSEGKVVVKLLNNCSKSGQMVYFTTLFYPVVDLNNNVIEHLLIMHDVSDIIKLTEEIELTQKEVVLTMGAIGETRSKETGLHVKRVAEYSYLLAKLSGLSEKKANLLKQASPMHDIGKVGIPDYVLNKPGKLTLEEFQVIKKHAFLGYEMLKYSKRDILKTAATIAYTHHEKWDGTGYPNKLKGENIPIEGRITAIADVFDALGHDRVYKKAWDLERIYDLFRNQKGKHFDPRLIDIFFENLEKFLEIKQRLEDKN